MFINIVLPNIYFNLHYLTYVFSLTLMRSIVTALSLTGFKCRKDQVHGYHESWLKDTQGQNPNHAAHGACPKTKYLPTICVQQSRKANKAVG